MQSFFSLCNKFDLGASYIWGSHQGNLSLGAYSHRETMSCFYVWLCRSPASEAIFQGWSTNLRPVVSSIPQGSLLGLVLFNWFISKLNKVMESTLSKFEAHETGSGWHPWRLGCHSVGPGQAGGLGERNLMRVTKGKLGSCTWEGIAPRTSMGWGLTYWRAALLRRAWESSSLAWMTSWASSVFVAKETSGILGCIGKSVDSTCREVFPLLGHGEGHLEYSAQFWSPQIKKDKEWSKRDEEGPETPLLCGGTVGPGPA